MNWHPTFGAWPEGDGTRFRVWAPAAKHVEVVLEGHGPHAQVAVLDRSGDGVFTAHLRGVGDGARYRYRLDGDATYPDPASRYQPEGVHGPSQVIDSARYQWQDQGWAGVPYDELIVYELHVGTFSPEGTFQGVTDRLPALAELGVTAVELMPVADFPGRRNWGYDGVDLFAPARCYGTADDLRRLVDRAHRLGLAVLLDVVYNHFGPDGNYLGAYAPWIESSRHRSPWGAGLNFDGEHSDKVRGLFLDNALYWLHDFHFDGLRLDATHAIVDDSPRHFLAELSDTVHAHFPGRRVHLIAEDHRNLATMLRPTAEGGWGLDGVWADDFHHQVRSLLAGDNEGYYLDFTGATADLAATMNRGWFYCGQVSPHRQEPRGTDPAGLPPRAFVVCLQNHDQIGNRAFGTRLNHEVDLAAYRAASVLLLAAAQTPLLLMGQEWAATSPFQFFTDHNPELGKLVTEGRRREFGHFSLFADPAVRELIPDPQADSTFEASRLRWDERERPPHAGVLRLYRDLLRLRRAEPALRAAHADSQQCHPAGENAVVLLRQAPDGPALVAVCQLRGFGVVNPADIPELAGWAGRRWQRVLSTEDPDYAAAAQPPKVQASDGLPVLYFVRPCAVVFREVR